jgi:plasmid stability protein
VAQIIVRNLEDDVLDKLRDRALQHGHSLEKEVRNIVRDAVMQQKSTPKKLGTILAERFAGNSDIDDEPFVVEELRSGNVEPINWEN